MTTANNKFLRTKISQNAPFILLRLKYFQEDLASEFDVKVAPVFIDVLRHEA